MENNTSNNINGHDDEEVDERTTFLKENFTLSDFLKDPNTYEILELNRIWRVDEDLYGSLEDFYKKSVDYNKANGSLLFSNENSYRNLGKLQGSVNSCLEKQYDLNIFYDNPGAARSMIENYNNRIKDEEVHRKKKIKEEYDKQETANMTFDWNTKKFNI